MTDINKIIEDIQQAQIKAGGKFLYQSEIKNMTVKEILELLVPNSVEFKINFKKDTEVVIDQVIKQEPYAVSIKEDKEKLEAYFGKKAPEHYEINKHIAIIF